LPKVSPPWFDQLLEREGITAEEYYQRLGQTRITFWVRYWAEEKVLEQWRAFWELAELGIEVPITSIERREVERIMEEKKARGEPIEEE